MFVLVSFNTRDWIRINIFKHRFVSHFKHHIYNKLHCRKECVWQHWMYETNFSSVSLLCFSQFLSCLWFILSLLNTNYKKGIIIIQWFRFYIRFSVEYLQQTISSLLYYSYKTMYIDPLSNKIAFIYMYKSTYIMHRALHCVRHKQGITVNELFMCYWQLNIYFTFDQKWPWINK